MTPVRFTTVVGGANLLKTVGGITRVVKKSYLGYLKLVQVIKKDEVIAEKQFITL
jgi:hypothetical protein